ncbi:MAG: PHB depolymerase family esterase [Burkholderiales bacterium]|nr:PHB depolymerase family esterase [Burkholderiales bacterium]
MQNFARLSWWLMVLLQVTAAHAADSLKPGDYRVPLLHQTLQRSYLVRMPPRANPDQPLPVVISFHGGGANAENQKWYTRMDETADREGFIAVYPNGSGGIGGRFLTWNAGNCCGMAALAGIDDIGFTLAMLDDLARRTPVDRSRIYATGLSNGSMMAYRLAAEAPERIAAVAGVAGAMTLPHFAPALPVAVMHIHSIDDQSALYDGGLGLVFQVTNTRAFHAPVDDMLGKWTSHNACPSQPEVTPSQSGKKGGPDETHTVTRFAWRPCKDGTEVVLLKLKGPGHVWPGGQRDYLPQLLGTATAVIDANDEMWRFFKRHARAGENRR